MRNQPGLTGREIANALSADKSEVNSLLWKLKNQGMTTGQAFCAKERKTPTASA